VNIPDGFVVYLRNLDPRDVSFEVIDEEDSRHVLRITTDVSLYIRRRQENLPSVIDGLRKLAVAASEMADALSPRDDVDHAIAADVDAQLREDGEALGRKIAADEDIEPEQLFVVVEHHHEQGMITRMAAGTRLEADTFARDRADSFTGQLEVIPARPGIDLYEYGTPRSLVNQPAALDDDEPPSRVPWPTGFCGHPVPPAAWNAGFNHCRDCIGDQDPMLLREFDAAAAPDLTVVDTPARPGDLDDADGER
jgi:hypothetical protein